jgi:hypothetical protein
MYEHDPDGVISRNGIRISNKGDRPSVTIFLNRNPY